MTSPAPKVSRSGFYKVLVGVHKFVVDKRYVHLRPIGGGSYGVVASAVDSITGQNVAIKKIRDIVSEVVDARSILREMRLLRHFKSHENIISILDIMVYPPNSPDFEDVYIVTNLYESDLDKIIRSSQVLTDKHFQFFLYQLLRALKYVHSANVLHRDLKPSNILVNANCDLAICDFGLARGFDVEADDTLTTYVVTRWYRSPEILFNSTSYGKGVDIWSVGCIFAELLTHQPFFRGENPQHQLAEIIRKVGCPNTPSKLQFVESPAALSQLMHLGNRPKPLFASFFPEGTDPLAIDLLKAMLQFNPDDRITVDGALSHVYLKDFTQALPATNCAQLFDFEFEKLVHGDTAADKEAVRYLMYEEMRIFRPNAPEVHPPWLPSHLSRQRSENSMAGEADGKRLRLGIARMGDTASSKSTPTDYDRMGDDPFLDAMVTSRTDDDHTPVMSIAGHGSFFGAAAREALNSADEKFYDARDDESLLGHTHKTEK